MLEGFIISILLLNTFKDGDAERSALVSYSDVLAYCPWVWEVNEGGISYLECHGDLINLSIMGLSLTGVVNLSEP